ncbi:MAG: prepilin peptidase [Desulfovibrionaceae bacterium]|nr:prepilin peptidase [Desulfovibrionaceae bacterium]
MTDTGLGIFLLSALAVATVTDLRGQRIPNKLTYPVMALALCYHGLTRGADGLIFGLAGLGLGLGLMIVPYLLGVMGAGDVKLMAAVGACLGAADTFSAFLFTSLAGGLYALALLLGRFQALKMVFRSLGRTLWIFMSSGRLQPAEGESGLPRLCYGVAIAAGTAAAMAFKAFQTGAPALP